MNPACCFTGFHQLTYQQEHALAKPLEAELLYLIHQNISAFLSGGEPGFDRMAAEAILALKQKGQPLRLTLVLPESAGANEKKQGEDALLSGADAIVRLTGSPESPSQYLARNATVCLCAYSPSEGVPPTVRFAEKRGLQIINIAEP